MSTAISNEVNGHGTRILYKNSPNSSKISGKIANPNKMQHSVTMITVITMIALTTLIF